MKKFGRIVLFFVALLILAATGCSTTPTAIEPTTLTTALSVVPTSQTSSITTSDSSTFGPIIITYASYSAVTNKNLPQIHSYANPSVSLYDAATPQIQFRFLSVTTQTPTPTSTLSEADMTLLQYQSELRQYEVIPLNAVQLIYPDGSWDFTIPTNQQIVPQIYFDSQCTIPFSGCTIYGGYYEQPGGTDAWNMGGNWSLSEDMVVSTLTLYVKNAGSAPITMYVDNGSSTSLPQVSSPTITIGVGASNPMPITINTQTGHLNTTLYFHSNW